MDVDSRNIHSFIIGEHGDSEIVAWSSTNISGVPLDQFLEMRGHMHPDMDKQEIAEKVKNSAYDIISKKDATYYGIAMSVRRICECMIRDEKSILPISINMHGDFGIEDVCLSMPTILSAEGMETHIPIKLSETEQENLKQSADTLKHILAGLDLKR